MLHPMYPSGNTWATTRIGDRHSVIRAPRSGRILTRRDPIFELVNTVVNEVRKRAFSAPQLIWSAGGRDAASAKKWRGVHPSILTVHRRQIPGVLICRPFDSP